MTSAEELLMDLHIRACAECRRASDAALAVGGALFDALPPAHLPPSLFQRTLQAIDALEAPVTAAAARAPAFAAKWPSPLRDRLAAGPLAQWRRLPAGFRARRVPF